MDSLIAHFHKLGNLYESRDRATRRMRREVKRIQKASRSPNLVECTKCEELFKKKELLHDEVSGLDFCSNCMDAIRILRDAR